MLSLHALRVHRAASQRWRQSPRRPGGRAGWRVAAVAFLLALLVSGGMARVASPARAASRVAADTSGSIGGVVVNGTHGGAHVARQSVTLQAVLGAKAQDISTTTSDALGHFSFSGLDTSGDTTYAVYSTFQGGVFPSSAIRFDTGGVQQVTLTVYDVTTSDAALRVGVANILVNAQTESNKLKGYIPMGEFLTFVNSGTTAYVGSVTPANGRPMNLLRFSLPSGATNLALGAGFAGVQVVQVGTGFGAQATVPPGKSQFAFAFDVAYTGTDYTFRYKAEYLTDRVAVLVTPSIGVVGRDFTAASPVSAGGVRYQALHRDTLNHDDAPSFQLTRLPLPGEDPVIDTPHAAAVAVLLALLLALALAVYLRRGDLAVALGLLPAPGRVSSARAAKAVLAQREAKRKRLLRALLALESAHDSGAITDADYQRRREATRQTLRDLLDDRAAPPSPAHADDSTATQPSASLTGERR